MYTFASANGVDLLIYPCVNPSGFEAGNRYNADGEGGREGECGNNDFVRYLLKDGSWRDDLGPDRSTSIGWFWSSDPEAKEHVPGLHPLPQETALLHESVKQLPLERVAALIDLHQDPFIQEPGTYAYVFGDRSRYGPIVERLARFPRAPLLSNRLISSGYRHPSKDTQTDQHGLLTRFDGSIADLLNNERVPHCVTVETTSSVPLDDALMVNWAWVNGVIEMAGKRTPETDAMNGRPIHFCP